MGIAEEGLEVEFPVASELGAIIEGYGLAQGLGEQRKDVGEGGGDQIGSLVGGSPGEDQPGGSLVKGEDGLAVFGEHHEIGFPMTGALTVIGGLWALGNGYAALDEVYRATASFAAKAAFGLALRQVAAPGEVIGAADLGIDEAVDGLVADHRSAVLEGEPAGDLLGRQTASEAGKNSLAQCGLALKPGAGPSPGFALLLGVAWFVGQLASVALQLAPNGRWRAIHSCSDLADRAAFGLKLGNRAAVFQ
jgi:hypothetical protein